jgi:hypothetical protein
VEWASSEYQHYRQCLNKSIGRRYSYSSSVAPTQTCGFAVAVTPGTNPTSTAHTVAANLTSIGGGASQTFLDDGLNGDVTAGDNIFSYNATVANGTSGGAKSLPFTITETAPQSRTGSGTISLNVLAPTNPSGTGAATPSAVEAGSKLTAHRYGHSRHESLTAGLTVTGDLSSIGGSASQRQFFDDGSNGDVTPGNNVFRTTRQSQRRQHSASEFADSDFRYSKQELVAHRYRLRFRRHLHPRLGGNRSTVRRWRQQWSHDQERLHRDHQSHRCTGEPGWLVRSIRFCHR